MKLISILLDIVIPRFVIEDVALVDCGDHYEIVCSMADLAPGESYDAVATAHCFNLFGIALFTKLVSEVRPWQEPT